MTMSKQVVFRVRPDTEEWGSEDDDRWRTDLAELHRLLDRRLPDETQDPPVAEGTRGAAELTDVIVALGSAGAISAAVEIFKTWVGARPGRRKVEVRVEAAGVADRTITVEADGLGAAELHDLAARALSSPAADASAD
jgi:hypothetical protein